jgi:hypothetical protein
MMTTLACEIRDLFNLEISKARRADQRTGELKIRAAFVAGTDLADVKTLLSQPEPASSCLWF